MMQPWHRTWHVLSRRGSSLSSPTRLSDSALRLGSPTRPPARLSGSALRLGSPARLSGSAASQPSSTDERLRSSRRLHGTGTLAQTRLQASQACCKFMRPAHDRAVRKRGASCVPMSYLSCLPVPVPNMQI